MDIMVKKNGRAEYANVNLPKKILEMVDEAVVANDFYSSRADFVKQAIKEKLEHESYFGCVLEMSRGEGMSKCHLDKMVEWAEMVSKRSRKLS